MMELPVPLRPWSAQLAIFPREVAVSLGPLVHRLASALGPMTSDARAESGEPDGFDGLTRRGSAERLLMSEWLLANEVPDEFLRRAASSELAYLQVSRREPRGIRRSIALLDAGPSQIGSPRIAQLAALIVLSRRAEAAKVPFAWGVLQDSWCFLHERIDRKALEFFLDERGAPEPGGADVQHWQSRLGAWENTDDLCIVGGSRALRLPSLRETSSLELGDILEPGVREVSVVWRSRARVMRSLRLPLPDDRACARMLHAPWEETGPQASASVVTGVRPNSNLVVCHTGRWAFARTGVDEIVAYPAWAGAHRNEPVTLRTPGVRVTAVGTHKRQFVAFSVDAGSMSVHAGKRGGNLTVKCKVQAPPRGSVENAAYEPLLPAIAVPRSQAPAGRMWAVTSHGALYSFHAHGAPVSLLEQGGVIAVSLVRGNVVTVQSVAGGALVMVRPNIRSPEFLPADPTRVLMGPATRGHSEIGVIAFQRVDGTWVIRDDAGLTPINVPDGIRVMGVTRTKDPALSGLVVVEQDRRSVSLLSKRGPMQLFRAQSPVHSVVINPVSADVIYSTERGDVGIHSVDERALLREFTVRNP